MQPTLPARRRMPYRIIVPALFLLASVPVQAQQQDDLRRLLEQRTEQQGVERERALLREEQDAGRPTITVDGQTHTVAHNANDVGRALYLSLQNRQWQAAARFLDEYLTLPGRDAMLEHYAQGMLARLQGHHDEAEREFRALLALQQDFLPGRLELARTLFEDQQDREAAELFQAIEASIDASDARTAGVRRTVATFRQALENRRSWNGTLALGPAWSDNVNRTSASHTCLLADTDGFCYVDRRLPDAIVASGLDFDGSLSRHLPLKGHHGLYLRSLLFGQAYRNHSAYNEASLTTQAGYSFRSARHSLAFAPSFDYQTLGNSALYGAWGLHAEWNYSMSAASLLKLEGDWKDLSYRQSSYSPYYDGVSRSVYLTYFRSLGPRWTLFGGVDLVDNDTPLAVTAYRQKGVRLGAALQWPEGFSSTLSASWRRRQHGASNALLEARREDDEQGYIFVIKAMRWAMAGFTPLLTLRHNRIDSSVDWLYSYDKSVVSLKLERTF